MKPFVIITGANRQKGIGLALVKTFHDHNWSVIGTYRDKKTSQPLLSLADNHTDIHALKLDVTSDESVAVFVKNLKKITQSINVLVNNAGIDESKGDMTTAPISQLEKQMQVHAIGPVRLTQALLPFLGKAKKKPAKVAVISSQLGTISSVSTSYTHYAPCKTAVNALVRQMGASLRNKNISMFSLHPGWVATDIGGHSAPLSSQESATGLYQVINSSDLNDAVTFRDYQGNALEW